MSYFIIFSTKNILILQLYVKNILTYFFFYKMLKNINNIAFKIIKNNVLKIFSYQNRMQCKKFLKEKHPI